ncbi:PIR-like protein [Plasmodium relictum]|uniref:PIR-like protein n=1 Tax=Plasmodium relictum TaxID=85471 RepID=A0A1J1GNH7_PLARL|nr:PIR-like protein [Plasmodium relictum]CRG84178.1 PIR-like protein [Plasmodium relictum]
MFNLSMTISYFLVLVWIFDYFCNISLWISNNNFKIIPYFKIGRTLAEKKKSLKTRVKRHAHSEEEKLNKWLEDKQSELLKKIENLHENNTCNNTDFIDWMHNKTNEMILKLNTYPFPNLKRIANDSWSVWEKLKQIFDDYFAYLKDKFSCRITQFNITDITDWMHNKSMNIVKDLNLNPNPDQKKNLNETYNLWNKVSIYVKNNIMKLQNNTMLNSSSANNNLSTPTESSPTSTSLSTPTPIERTSSHSSTLSPISTLPSTSSSIPTTSPTKSSMPILPSTSSSTFNISPTSSSTPTISPTKSSISILPSTSSSTLNISPTSSSTSILSPTSTSSYDDLTNSSTAVDSTDYSSSVAPLVITGDIDASTNGLTPLILEGRSSSTYSTACTGLLCGPTIAAISAPLAIVGVAFSLVLLYKYTPIGSLLGKNNINIRKKRKRTREKLVENTMDPPELLNETGESSPKRSRLSSFLRAFGFRYRSIFPFIDEDKTMR